MHLAVDNGETKMIEWCLKFGFNVTTRNKSEMNCMHIAARRGNYDVAVRILNVAAAEVKSLVNSEDSVKSTPLYLAAKFGNQNIMELLLDKYVNGVTSYTSCITNQYPHKCYLDT